MTDSDDDTDEPTVECTLTEEARERREQWVRAELLPRLEHIEERGTDRREASDRASGERSDQRDGANGFELVFDGSDETLRTVAEAVRRESACCSFADYEIRVEPPYEETRLRVSAPDGADELLREGFVEAFDEVSRA